MLPDTKCLEMKVVFVYGNRHNENMFGKVLYLLNN